MRKVVFKNTHDIEILQEIPVVKTEHVIYAIICGKNL